MEKEFVIGHRRTDKSESDTSKSFETGEIRCYEKGHKYSDKHSVGYIDLQIKKSFSRRNIRIASISNLDVNKEFRGKNRVGVGSMLILAGCNYLEQLGKKDGRKYILISGLPISFGAFAMILKYKKVGIMIGGRAHKKFKEKLTKKYPHIKIDV